MTTEQTAINIVAAAKMVPDQDIYGAVIKGITQALQEKDRIIAVMREALEFYAGVDNKILNAHDHGKKARNALKGDK